MSDHWLKLLLRVLGVICVLAVIPVFAPWSWLDAGHRFLGMGAFPEGPIAEYLARSVCALSAFYGGLLLLLAGDVRRYVSIIQYQALAIMALSAIGIYAGTRAGVPAYLVVGDAVGCWIFLLPILILAVRLSRDHPRQTL